MTVPVKAPAQGDIMEAVIAKGDLGKLTPEERVRYYNEVCRSIGLNPLVQPFSYIVLNGKLTLYATRSCADQLRKINSVSLEIVSRDVTDGVLTVHVRAKMPCGVSVRVDEDLGSVAFPDTLKGEARANAELKAVTKAKRRATLSICGLGWLDETEIQDIPESAKRPAPPATNVMLPHDADTGEIEPPKADGNPGTQAASPAGSESVTAHDPHAGSEPNYIDSDILITYEETLTKVAGVGGNDALKAAWLAIPAVFRKDPRLIAVKERLKAAL